MIALVNSVLAQQGRPQIAVTATPEEVAEAIEFLIRATYCTGTVLTVAGGLR